jgi:ribose 5-phosphate isomerase A
MNDAQRLMILAAAVADEVRSGMVVGLGTGATADAVIHELGRRVATGLAIVGVPTSLRTERLAQEVGISLTTLNDVARIDLGFDGADEINPSLDAVKGRGGALLHEKLVALACDDYMLVASAEKFVSRLGTRLPLPVEVIPFGWQHTATRISKLGGEPILRTDPNAPETPATSDGGHFLLDCAFGPIGDPAALAAALKATTGVVDHGLFVGLAQRVIGVEPDGSIRRLNRVSSDIR